ncbi:UNVERIFIED_ORG: dTMP kinase [Arthrobacter sp. UYEF2]
MSVLAERLGIRWPRRLADIVETTLRVANVLISHAWASRSDGLVVMDRHLHCQLALRTAKGLPRGRLLPWLMSSLPEPDAVVHLYVGPALAHKRIVARGTDSETLTDLADLRDAYRAMPEYPGLVQLDADSTPEGVVAGLKRIVHQRMSRAETPVAV